MSTPSSLTTPAGTAVAAVTAWISVNGAEVAFTPDVGPLAALVARFAPSCAPGGTPSGAVAGTAVGTAPDVLADPSAPVGVAAAVNDRVVPRSAWATTELHAGDRVEIVTAVQGG